LFVFLFLSNFNHMSFSPAFDLDFFGLRKLIWNVMYFAGRHEYSWWEDKRVEATTFCEADDW
jgi:hypothetical protein